LSFVHRGAAGDDHETRQLHLGADVRPGERQYRQAYPDGGVFLVGSLLDERHDFCDVGVRGLLPESNRAGGSCEILCAPSNDLWS
jgi:hypothetical protein